MNHFPLAPSTNAAYIRLTGGRAMPSRWIVRGNMGEIQPQAPYLGLNLTSGIIQENITEETLLSVSVCV